MKLDTSSWKTTVAGVVTALGLFLITLEDPMLKSIGQVLAAVGALLTGVFARDNNKTSEQVKAGK